jgi:hypothetical protein
MAAITPDMVFPKPHDFTPGVHPAVRESSDNIPFRSRPVRVQTVNANRDTKKCRPNLIGAIFVKRIRNFAGNRAFRSEVDTGSRQEKRVKPRI